MRTHLTRTSAFAFAFALMFLIMTAGCEAPSSNGACDLTSRALAWTTPESVGMSSQRLTRLHHAMQGLVDDGRLAGITTLIARHGQIVDFQSYGYRDKEAADPMAEAAIFRIYSMSKPITGVALMMLYEEGKFRSSGQPTPARARPRMEHVRGHGLPPEIMAFSLRRHFS